MESAGCHGGVVEVVNVGRDRVSITHATRSIACQVSERWGFPPSRKVVVTTSNKYLL